MEMRRNGSRSNQGIGNTKILSTTSPAACRSMQLFVRRLMLLGCQAVRRLHCVSVCQKQKLLGTRLLQVLRAAASSEISGFPGKGRAEGWFLLRCQQVLFSGRRHGINAAILASRSIVLKVLLQERVLKMLDDKSDTGCYCTNEARNPCPATFRARCVEGSA